MSLPDVCRLAIHEAIEFFSQLEFDPIGGQIAAAPLKEILGRLGFLINVGLDYLSLDRPAPSLSGGESQRIRLAGQIGCGLVGVLYVLDEPSIGLHPRDNTRLLRTLEHLRDLGNTVVVVEHDEETMRAADHIIDFGPGAGERGGEVIATGRLSDIRKARRSVTGQFLAGRQQIAIPAGRRTPGRPRLKILGARHNNLKGMDVEIPVGLFVCVTGVSGSGKSSLVDGVLAEGLRRSLGGEGRPGLHRRIVGSQHLDRMISIDQSPIGRTPRSNPATYIKVFDDIRALFAELPEAKRRGYAPGRFSFNVTGGRCEACQGNGSNRLEMDFLADIWVTCPVCEGHRFNRETLAVCYKNRSIAQILEMDVADALAHFENIPPIRRKLQTLHDVGLDYLKLGQASPTLSGGEAQRIKLARELVKRSTGKTLYLLDEPTTGLHFADIRLLLNVLHGFVDAGNTVIVVEHNLDVIKTADWVIDLGPEGGEAGGELVAAGTPEEIARCRRSYTGEALAPLLTGTKPKASRQHRDRADSPSPRRLDAIRVRGAAQHNLKHLDVDIPRDQLTVFCGPSGSGKSSLAIDTIYAEGQRRYVESLSAYARQFVGQLQKPQLEQIEGLSPAIALEQRHLGHTPRSTVGTVTEIHDYLRILFARLGIPHCPTCRLPVGTQTSDQIVDKILSEPEGARVLLSAPRRIDAGQSYSYMWHELFKAGFQRVRIDRQTHSMDSVPRLDRRRIHDVEVIVDRITVRKAARSRIADSVELALGWGQGNVRVVRVDDEKPEPHWPVRTHSLHMVCEPCGMSFQPLTPHHFSFNSPLGWCPSCQGIGTQMGTHPSLLIRDGTSTLAEGAIMLWPQMDQPVSQAMLAALSAHTGLPIDVPFDELPPHHRRTLFSGTGDAWIDVQRPGDTSGGSPWFRFQYKGLHPSLDDAARLSTFHRSRIDKFLDEIACIQCLGGRLEAFPAACRFRGLTITQLSGMNLRQLLAEVEMWALTDREQQIAGEVIHEIRNRLGFLLDVGLDYLTLERPAGSLSGGESQRIRLASQVGSGLCGVLYVLDEPTIGLHPRDNHRLMGALKKLRDLGNTLLVVEHDRHVLAESDGIVDFGPGAGRHGGRIVAQGTPTQVAAHEASVTGPYLSGSKVIAVPAQRRIRRLATGPDLATAIAQVAQGNFVGLPPHGPGWLTIHGAEHHNLKGIDVAIPLGTLTAVTGPSGSGKSSLIDGVLHAALARRLHHARTVPGRHGRIEGVAALQKVIRVDQQPLGSSPMSNAATYTGAFDHIRLLFSELPGARLCGFSPGRFSFNVSGGRCEACQGQGQVCVAMHFLPDVWIPCQVCGGKRYEPRTLEIRYRGRSIADVLEMPCGEAAKLFENVPSVHRILETLCEVGLDYLQLGQSAATLSGGEAQRVKLAAELSRPHDGRTLYLLDEPTTGLHFDDLTRLLDVLARLVELGNTVLVVEHNLDVIKSADWVIDLGPEAGDAGGHVVAVGRPEDIVRYAAWVRESAETSSNLPRCHTGEALLACMEVEPGGQRSSSNGERFGRTDGTQVSSAKTPRKRRPLASPGGSLAQPATQ
jgi:excinuclease ABC subunit A